MANRSSSVSCNDSRNRRRRGSSCASRRRWKRWGQLTGGIAHDFNNILTVILANADALQEEESLDAGLTVRLEQIAQGVARASGLTRQLLAFSRKQPLSPQRTDINDLVADTGKLLRRALGEQIEIESVLADGLWTVNIDRAQLETALVNLCVNARDAMPDGGKLLIETRKRHARRGLCRAQSRRRRRRLRDACRHRHRQRHAAGRAGQGVRAVLHHQGGRQGNRPRPQHGLWLHQAVQRPHHDLQRGRPRNHVQALSAAQRRRAGRSGVAAEPPMPRGTERILVVEDDPQVRASVVQQLQSLGYAVSEAADGTAGLASFEAAAQPYDLLLTDVVMPGPLNGKAWPTR